MENSVDVTYHGSPVQNRDDRTASDGQIKLMVPRQRATAVYRTRVPGENWKPAGRAEFDLRVAVESYRKSGGMDAKRDLNMSLSIAARQKIVNCRADADYDATSNLLYFMGRYCSERKSLMPILTHLNGGPGCLAAANT